MSEITLYPLKSIVKGGTFFNDYLEIDDGMTQRYKDRLFKIINYEQGELSTGFNLHTLAYVIRPYKPSNSGDDDLCFESIIVRHSEIFLVNNKLLLKDNKCK